MLMGTADTVAAPTESTVFLEDMTDVQKAAKVTIEDNNAAQSHFINSWYTEYSRRRE